MGPTGCPKTSLTKYQYTPRELPVEQRSNLHRSEGMTSRFRIVICVRTKGQTDNVAGQLGNQSVQELDAFREN
jgi:hypothetical protein